MTPALGDLVERVHRLVAAADERVVLGIIGPPGSGKTTLAIALVEAFGDGAAWLPMDGFHLADSELERQGIRNRKGAIETFDGWGYLATLRRLRAEADHTVYSPEFDRTLEQPVAGGVAIGRGIRLVVTEGNYLLDATEPWSLVRAELAEAWYCQADPALRVERLIARHIRFGKTPEQASAHVFGVDEPNAVRIEGRRGRADLVIESGE